MLMGLSFCEFGRIINFTVECEPCNKPGHICDPDTGRCVCPMLSEGSACERCKNGAWGHQTGAGCKVIYFNLILCFFVNDNFNFSPADVIPVVHSHLNVSTEQAPALADQDSEAPSVKSVFRGIMDSLGAERVTATSPEPRRSRVHTDNLVDVMKLDSATAK